MTTAIKIATQETAYRDGLLASETISVEGAGRWGLCHITVIPEGQSARQTHGGPLTPGPWAFTTTHPLVIDNYGGSAAERESALKIEAGQPIEVEGLPGIWTFAAREARKLEGDGVKLIPYEEGT